jgi:hypothetical protein
LLLSLRLKYSLRHPLLKDLQFRFIP